MPLIIDPRKSLTTKARRPRAIVVSFLMCFNCEHLNELDASYCGKCGALLIDMEGPTHASVKKSA